ncbi:hypothetical protein [Citricoccus sp. SGAir0253]|nr:hypothetical protein [Citricoccus sp. SGAir0253]
MSTTLRRTRIAAALAVASIALTACANTVRDSSTPSASSTPPGQ